MDKMDNQTSTDKTFSSRNGQRFKRTALISSQRSSSNKSDRSDVSIRYIPSPIRTKCHQNNFEQNNSIKILQTNINPPNRRVPTPHKSHRCLNKAQKNTINIKDNHEYIKLQQQLKQYEKYYFEKEKAYEQEYKKSQILVNKCQRYEQELKIQKQENNNLKNEIIQLSKKTNYELFLNNDKDNNNQIALASINKIKGIIYRARLHQYENIINQLTQKCKKMQLIIAQLSLHHNKFKCIDNYLDQTYDINLEQRLYQTEQKLYKYKQEIKSLTIQLNYQYRKAYTNLQILRCKKDNQINQLKTKHNLSINNYKQATKKYIKNYCTKIKNYKNIYNSFIDENSNQSETFTFEYSQDD